MSAARAYTLVFLASVMWGGTAVAGKLVIQSLPTVDRRRPPLWRLRARPDRPLPPAPPHPATLGPRDVARLFAIGALGTCLNHVLFFFGLMWAPATHGALVPSTTRRPSSARASGLWRANDGGEKWCSSKVATRGPWPILSSRP